MSMLKGRRFGGWGWAFGAGCALGAAVFLLLYGPSTLDVQYDSWIYLGYIEQDIIQRYGGWLWFRQAAWSFPLTVAENFAQPYGGCITFTDSVPLAAIICKLFAPVLPETFQYFGWVNFINFALQGGFAALLLRRFKVGWLYGAGGVALFLLLPPFVERAFRHDSLACHWVLLAALYCYFLARDGRRRAPFVGFVLLCGGVISLHTYYLPMVAAVLAAALLEACGRNWRGLKAAGARRAALLKAFGGPVLAGALCVAAALLCAAAMGLLTRGGGGEAAGFGDYTLNLNALVNPASFDWYAPDETLRWSAVLPVLPRFHHQYEGFMYLGGGVLLAGFGLVVYGAARAVLAVRRGGGRALLGRVGGFLRGHLWLLLACAVLTAFALSHIVTLGERVLFTLPLGEKLLELCAIFRASSRMFWPCLYLLVLGVLVAWARLLKGRWRLLAVALALLVQLADTSPALAQKHAYFSSGPLALEDQFTQTGWRFMAENYDNVICLNGLYDYELFANLIRYNPQMQSNIIGMNRGSYPLIVDACIPKIEDLAAGEAVPQGTLYILKDDYVFEDVLEGQHPDARGYIAGDYYLLALPVEGCPLEAHLPGSMEGSADGN